MNRVWMSLLLLALCGLPCLAAEPVIAAKGLPEDKLVLLGPKDDGFETAMATILQGKHDALIESVKSMGVVLRNDSDRVLVAFSVRFHTDPAGPWAPTGMGYGAVEDLLDGGQRRAESRYFRRRIWVIPAGSSRFIAPWVTIGQGDAVNDVAQRGGAALLRVQSSLDRKRAEWQDHTVTIVLESAMFDDGEVVGPKAVYEAQGFRDELAAYQAVFSDAVAKASSGMPRNAWIRYLQEVADRNANTECCSPDYWRSFYAGRLLMIARKDGDDAAIQYAAERLFRHPAEVHVGKRWAKETAQKSRP